MIACSSAPRLASTAAGAAREAQVELDLLAQHDGEQPADVAHASG